VSEENTKGSLRPLAEDEVDWVYAMCRNGLPFLFGRHLNAFNILFWGGSKNVAKLSLLLLNKLRSMLLLLSSAASVW
jgi:prepilin-type processing-associated H-X9-DG protein